jgi:hypothetical protein
MGTTTINKVVAPADWMKFQVWYKLACTSSNLTAEEAYKSLGYKIPTTDENKRIKKAVK